jgi:hypothetical protein
MEAFTLVRWQQQTERRGKDNPHDNEWAEQPRQGPEIGVQGGQHDDVRGHSK